MLRTVHLYGPLKDKYGAQHSFYLNDVADALNALEQLPGFRDTIESYNRIAVVKSNGDIGVSIKENEINRPLGDYTDLHIVPEVEGAWEGATALAAWATSTTAATVSWWAVAAAYVAINVVAAIALNGLARMFAPSPETGGTTSENKQDSFLFSGPMITTVQGSAIPLVYGGPIRIGGVQVNLITNTVEIPVGAPSNSRPGKIEPYDPPIRDIE